MSGEEPSIDSAYPHVTETVADVAVVAENAAETLGTKRNVRASDHSQKPLAVRSEVSSPER
jgi:hypothetical protein